LSHEPPKKTSETTRITGYFGQSTSPLPSKWRCAIAPDGGSFIRAYDAGAFRSLTNREFIDFLEALQEMPWNWRNKAQGGELTVPLMVNAE
jgi:hypothetical protein